MPSFYAEVIGDPIAHSQSPLIHNFWLQKLGVAADYRRKHVRQGDLLAYFRDRQADLEWLGCNVTIPHKTAVMRFAEDRDGACARIGAMNTIYRDPNGKLIGANTDAGGFIRPLLRRKWTGQRAVIVGAGGAARAVLSALISENISHVTVMARDQARARALLAHAYVTGDVLPLNARVPCTDLLVNCSSLGMTGHPLLDLDISALSKHSAIYDIVYAPLETGLITAGRQRGLTVIDGLEMLVCQAAIAFEKLFRVSAPHDFDDELRGLLIASSASA